MKIISLWNVRGNTLCIMVLQILGGLPQKVILSIAVGFLPFVRLFLSLNFVVLSVSNFFYVCLFSSCFLTTAMMIMNLDRGGGLSDRGQTDGRTVHCGSLILILMHPPIKKGIVGCWCLYWGHPTDKKRNLHCANRLGIPHVKKCIWNVDYIIFFFIYVMWN